jgi:hypothetical protein
MTVELSVIENLGLKMYVTIPPVLSEIVANSWDADATQVSIKLPTGTVDNLSEITIEDNGIGMTNEEINDKFLRIGRKRREEKDGDKTPKGRKPMGCKGIGKLAPFGVAKVVEVDTCSDHVANSFRMNIDRILEAAKLHQPYLPEPIKINVKDARRSGTKITLKTLKRTTPIDVDSYRKGIAKRFSIIGRDFVVVVNGKKVAPDDWLKQEDMQYSWTYNNAAIDDSHPDWVVNGWLGTTRFPSPEEERGVIVMARGKLCQDTPFYFGAVVGEKISYAYIAGILHAEFLDAEEDNIATHRAQFLWESPAGAALMEWGKKELQKVANTWSENRRRDREKVIREDPEFKEWLETLPRAEAKLANKVIGAITKDELITDERRKELAGFMKDSFEHQAFQELVAALPEEPDDAQLIEAFEEWGLIEAKEILQMVKGRISTIEQFVKFVRENAREKPTIHNFFKEWPWILDPTWTQWNDEVHFSQLLRDNFPDGKLDEPNRRIDFVCIGAGDTVHIIELKRPGYKINADDLEQLFRYVSFVRSRLGTVPVRGYRDASGYIVCGEISDDHLTKDKIELFRSERMYVRRYDDLITIAQRLHEDFRRKLEEFETKRRERMSKSNPHA